MSVEPSEDTALVARVSRGDRSAFEQLYRRHGPWLTTRLQSRCGDPELVDIAVQDAFVAVWKSASKYRGDGEVGAWIWGIAIRRLVDQMRKRRPTPIDVNALAGHVTTTNATRGPAAGFEEDLIDSGPHGYAAPVIAQLPADLRAVLILTAIDGLTTKEASVVLGIPQGTVKTRLQRARAASKEFLS